MEKQEIEATEKAPKAVAKSSSRTVIGATHITSNKRNEATCPPPPRIMCRGQFILIPFV